MLVVIFSKRDILWILKINKPLLISFKIEISIQDNTIFQKIE